MPRLRVPIIFGLIVVTMVFITAVMAPIVAPYAENDRDIEAVLDEPSSKHLLGTDESGGDVLSHIIYGSRVAIIVGLGTVFVSLLIGFVIGSISGYFGGRIDEALMRLTEIVLAFPGILLAIFIIFLTQKPGLSSVILALSITGWAGYSRLVRGQILQAREVEFVAAARSLGASVPRIIIRHLIPNILAPVIVQATFGVAGAILAEASLSFLGLGPQTHISWGALLDQGAVLFIKTPYLAIFSGSAIFLTVLSINFIGDYLRDWMDPKGKARENY